MHLCTSKRWRSRTKSIALCKQQAPRQLCTSGSQALRRGPGEGKALQSMEEDFPRKESKKSKAFWLSGERSLPKMGNNSKGRPRLRTPDSSFGHPKWPRACHSVSSGHSDSSVLILTSPWQLWFWNVSEMGEAGIFVCICVCPCSQCLQPCLACSRYSIIFLIHEYYKVEIISLYIDLSFALSYYDIRRVTSSLSL